MNLDEENNHLPTRRDVIARLTVGLSAAVTGASAHAEPAPEVVRNMESIHHERKFKASPQRVYAALTDEKQFQQIVLLSGAVKRGMVKDPQPAQISTLAGGPFAMFGGYISGRQIEPTRDFQEAKQNIWLKDGNPTTGNRLRLCCLDQPTVL